MNTKKKKSKAVRFLEELNGGSLTIAQAINSSRLCEEISQAELGARIGASRAYVCDVEKGRRIVTPERALEFAVALGMPPNLYVRLALQDALNRAGINLSVSVEAA